MKRGVASQRSRSRASRRAGSPPAWATVSAVRPGDWLETFNASRAPRTSPTPADNSNTTADTADTKLCSSTSTIASSLTSTRVVRRLPRNRTSGPTAPTMASRRAAPPPPRTLSGRRVSAAWRFARANRSLRFSANHVHRDIAREGGHAFGEQICAREDRRPRSGEVTFIEFGYWRLGRRNVLAPRCAAANNERASSSVRRRTTRDFA